MFSNTNTWKPQSQDKENIFRRGLIHVKYFLSQWPTGHVKTSPGSFWWSRSVTYMKGNARILTSDAILLIHWVIFPISQRLGSPIWRPHMLFGLPLETSGQILGLTEMYSKGQFPPFASMETVPNQARRSSPASQFFSCHQQIPMDNPSLFSLGRCQNTPRREHFLSKSLVELGRSTFITPSRPRI